MFLTFKNKINDETLEEARGRTVQTGVRPRPAARRRVHTRAHVLDTHPGVPPGARGQTEVRA